MLSVQLYTCTQPSSVPSHIVDCVRSISVSPSDLLSDVVDDTLVIDAGVPVAGDCSFCVSRCNSVRGFRAAPRADDEFNWALNSMSDSLSLELLESSCNPVSPSAGAGVVSPLSAVLTGNRSSLPPVVGVSRGALEREVLLLIKYKYTNKDFVLFLIE